MGKWSDGLIGDEEMDGLSRESEAVMTRSRMWLSEWVGKVTCCVRFMDDRREENCLVCDLDGSSTWRLKSPVITKW